MLPAPVMGVGAAMQLAMIAADDVAVAIGAMAAVVGVRVVAVAATTAMLQLAAPLLAAVPRAASRVGRAAVVARVLRLPRVPAWIATRSVSTLWPSAVKAIATTC